MRVVIFGGCGFIGSHILDRLLATGHCPTVFDRHPDRFRAPLSDVGYQFGNFCDPAAVRAALVGQDAVVHLVSTTFPGTADADPARDVRENLLGTLALLDAMSDFGVRRLLYLSSGGTVYGIPDALPIAEAHALRPIGSYGIVKVAIEHYLDLYRRTRGLLPLAVRASNPYGPRQGHAGVQGVISTFLGRLRDNQPVDIWGDGEIIRDYVFVRDLAEFCVTALTSEATGTCNAGSGVGISINQIVQDLAAVTHRPIVPRYLPGRAVDVPCSVLDVSRAAAEFGWHARTPLAQGLAETWAWLQKAAAQPSLTSNSEAATAKSSI